MNYLSSLTRLGLLAYRLLSTRLNRHLRTGLASVTRPTLPDFLRTLPVPIQ